MTTNGHAPWLCSVLELSVTSFCYDQTPSVCFEHTDHFPYLQSTIPKEDNASPVVALAVNASSRGAIDSLIQLHIHNHEIIRRERLLENRFQFFFLCHGEAFGTVELSELW